MKNYIETEGFLVGLVWLANDDALLTFLTPDLGKVSVFVSKLARSKKKRAEIDWFRKLRLNLKKGKGESWKLSQVETLKVWPVSVKDYSQFESALKLLERINSVVPESKPDAHLYLFWVTFFEQCDLAHFAKYIAYGRLQLLAWSGICPRFDHIRGDGFFDVSSLSFVSVKGGDAVYEIPNEVRQVLEFLRRSDLGSFQEKINNLPNDTFHLISKMQGEIEKYH